MLRRSPSAFVVRAALCLLAWAGVGVAAPSVRRRAAGAADPRRPIASWRGATRPARSSPARTAIRAATSTARSTASARRPERLHERRRRRAGHAARRAADAPREGAAPKPLTTAIGSLPMATENCTDGGLVEARDRHFGRARRGEGHAPRDRGRRRQEGQGHLQARLQSRAADARHQHPARSSRRRCTFAGCHRDGSRNPISRSRTASPQPGSLGSPSRRESSLRVKPGNLRKHHAEPLPGTPRCSCPTAAPSTRRPKAAAASPRPRST
jgi:hypothetical protein